MEIFKHPAVPGDETEWPNIARHRGLDPHRIPAHVAVIMDGNGRWAKAHRVPRQEGHRRGVDTVRNTVKVAHVLGIQYLTLYSFSSENWNRPAEEVTGLMSLLKYFIRNDLKELCRQNVKITVIGRRDDLSADIHSLLEEAETASAANTGLNLIIAFNYGGQDEIVRAVQRLAAATQRGDLKPEEITADHVSQALDTASIPEPDLLLRTSGEKRISNFLIWQCAYTEFVFQDVLWPDFTGYHLIDAMIEFQGRDRRYGGRPSSDNVSALVSGVVTQP